MEDIKACGDIFKYVAINVQSVTLEDYMMLHEKADTLWSMEKMKRLLPPDIQQKLRAGIIYTASLSPSSKDNFYNLLLTPKKDRKHMNQPMANRPQTVTVTVKSEWVADEWKNAINNNGRGMLWESIIVLI